MPRDLPAARHALDDVGDVGFGAVLGEAAVPQVVAAALGAVGDEAKVVGVHALNLAPAGARVNHDFVPAAAGYLDGAQALKETRMEPANTDGRAVLAIADQLSAMDGLDRRDRYVEAMRVAKVFEEAGEAMQALIAYHNVNPRKPPGSLGDVIKELCDVALTAKVAIENFGADADAALATRERQVLDRLRAHATANGQG